MKISVATVCWNAASTIRQTLDSFFAQSYPDKELVVVDGASKDDTLEIVRSYASDGMVIISEPDRGLYDGLNKALRLYTGDVFGALNADDCYHSPDVLARIAEELETADVVFANLDFVTDHVSRQVTRRWQGSPMPKDRMANGWMPAHPTFYCRREVAEAVGEFDISYRIAGDYEWMLRMLHFKASAPRYVNATFVNMLAGGMSTNGLRAAMINALEPLRARQKWLGAGPIDYAMFAKPISKLTQLRLFQGAK